MPQQQFRQRRSKGSTNLSVSNAGHDNRYVHPTDIVDG